MRASNFSGADGHAGRCYGRRPLPPFPGWWAALGPGVVWMALAQGSGELIWWPYIIAKYGLTFLWVLIPACLLQYPLNIEIGRYTLLTGESIFHGFIRLHRGLGIFLWLLMTLSFLWFGAFASAGGTAIAALVD
ncbi:MAG: Nramp family divalent metal transporter, partial [Gammaproteobacteria bacterium]